MATHVVTSAAPLPVAIVCDDRGVAAWAENVGAEVIWCPGTGLNGAVQQGVAELATRGVAHVVVSHSDLPFSPGFDRLRPWPGVTLVPDRHHSGTNVMAVPADLGFQFSYGTGSFARHVREAVRLRKGLRIIHEAALGWDIDYPADLIALNGPPGHEIPGDLATASTSGVRDIDAQQTGATGVVGGDTGHDAHTR